MIRFAVPLLVLATAATGAASQQRAPSAEQVKFEKALAGLTPGAPLNCVPSDRITEVKGYDGEILYISGRNRVYRNKTVGSCDGIERGDVIVTKMWGGRRYCSGDIVTTREQTSGTFTGSCSLGKFVPYTK